MKNGMSVRKYLTQNPNASTRAVVKATGASAKSVGTMRWALRKEGIDCTPAKRGRKSSKVVDLSAAGSPLGEWIIPVNERLVPPAPARPKTRMQGAVTREMLERVNEELAALERANELSVGVDLVNAPPHYTAGGIETIDFIEAKKLNYNLGNAVKYISRADHKGNRIQDLQKAKWYIEREILAQHI
jgi:hypothetical protein